MPRSVEFSIQHGSVRVDRKVVKAAIQALDQAADRFNGGCPQGELSVVVLSDEALAGIHEKFLSDPSATDVITFEGQAPLGTAGEICISADSAASYASTHKRPFSEELTLYLVHGWLHLAGYDDLQPPLKRVMRRAEKRAISLLAELRLLKGFRWKPASRKLKARS